MAERSLFGEPIWRGDLSRRRFLAIAGQAVAAIALCGIAGSALSACSSGSTLSGPFMLSYDGSGSFQGTIGGQSVNGSGQSIGSYGPPFRLTGNLGATDFRLDVTVDGNEYTATGSWGSQHVSGSVRLDTRATTTGQIAGQAGGSPISGVITKATVENDTGQGTISGSLS